MKIRDKIGTGLHRLANKVGGRYYGGPTSSASLSVGPPPDIRPAECGIESAQPYASDWLGREEFGLGLERLTTYGSGSGVLLIDGKWGTGKTTFIRMWAASLRNNGRTVVEVNAWAGDYADAPFDDIARQFGRGLREHKKSFGRWTRVVASTVGPLMIGMSSVPWLASLAAKFDADVVASIVKLLQALQRAARSDQFPERRMRRLKKQLAGVAKYYWKRRRKSIVLVIDELDRCRPDYALRFLETIKHVFEVPHVTFVVAANAQELGKAVKGVYGESFDGEEYVERFFDIWLPLPVGDRRNFVERCLDDQRLKANAGQDIVYQVGESTVTAEQLAGDLLEMSNLSPRKIKKAIKHIAITLLFNRSDSGALAGAIVFLGLVGHIAADRYQTINDSTDPKDFSKTLLSSISCGGDAAAVANLVNASAKAVLSDAETRATARRALEGSSGPGLGGNQGDHEG